MSLKKERLIAAALLLFFFLRCFDAAKQNSITYDETAHIPAGYLYVTAGDFSVNPEHPPLCKILAGSALLGINPSLPPGYLDSQEIDQWRFGTDFFRENSVSIDTIALAARLPLIILGVILGLAVYLWSRRMYGKWAALGSLFLYTFCPNFLAHSPLANTDVGGSLFIFLTMFAAYLFYTSKDEKYILYAGISFGLALAAKFTAPVLLIPVFILILLHYAVTGGSLNRFFKYAPKILLASVISVAVLALFYGFYHFPWYFRGLSYVLSQTGAAGRQTYLNGQFSATGFRSYYAFAFLFKTPLPFIILIAGSFFYGIKRKEMFLLYPVIVLFIIASLSKMQLGVRYILPMYPFIYVLAGKFFSGGVSGRCVGKLKAVLITLLILWSVFTSVRYHPSYIAYFNEIAGGPENGHVHLLDSNIDWGQDLKNLRRYIEKEGNPDLVLAYFGSIDPAVYGIKSQPLFPVGSYSYWLNSYPPDREYLAVNLNHLYGLHLREGFFEWLRPLEPMGRVGCRIYVYDITDNLYARENLYHAYRFMGFDAAARREEAIIQRLSGD